MASAYRKAKAWWVLRYRFSPWLVGQVPGLVVGAVLALCGLVSVLPTIIDEAWQAAYSCEDHAKGFTCTVKERHAD